MKAVKFCVADAWMPLRQGYARTTRVVATTARLTCSTGAVYKRAAAAT
jgi:hypothetical protein